MVADLPITANTLQLANKELFAPPFIINGTEYPSVWECPKWPHDHTKPTQYTPACLRQCILAYSETTTGIKEIFEKHGIDYHSAFDNIERYPEAYALYARAKLRRTDYLVDEVYQKTAAFAEFQTDGKGGLHQNSAGAKCLDIFSRHTEWLAERINPAFRLKTENYNANINANLQAKIDLPDDCTLADIWQAMHRQMRG